MDAPVTHIGLKTIGRSNDIVVLGEILDRNDEFIHFLCVNGGWSGKYYPKNSAVTLDNTDDGERFGVTMTYEGPWPKGARDYNDAIRSINEEANKKAPVKPEDWNSTTIEPHQFIGKVFSEGLMTIERVDNPAGRYLAGVIHNGRVIYSCRHTSLDAGRKACETVARKAME